MADGPSLSPSSSEHRLSIFDPRLAILWIVLLGYVLWPILLVLIESVWTRGEGFTLEPWRQFIEKEHYIYGLRSVFVSVATVAIAGVIGTALAFLYFRLEFPGRTVFAGLALLPFTLPPLVGVFAIWNLMGEDGLFHTITRSVWGDGIWFEKGYGGVLLVHGYSMYVYFYVLVGGALASFDETQIEAARDLGASRLQTLFRVVLPQLVPAIAGASVLAFMTSMASFTAPFYYMAGKPVLTVGIQQAAEEALNGLASADSVVLTICAAIFLTIFIRFERAFEGGTRGAARRRVQMTSAAGRWSLTLGAAFLTLLLLAPHISMVRESFVKSGTGFIGSPLEYTTENYSRLWQRDSSLEPIITSLRAAAMATLAVVLFALTSSWVAARREFRGKGAMRALVMLPWALPGTVIGIGLLWFTRSPHPLTLGANLRGTVTILAMAYFVRLMPLAHRTITAGLSRVPRELESAARDLGASPWRAFLRVTLPLIAPAVVAAATLTFVTAMGEFVSSLLLQGPGTEPIAVKIDQLRRGPGGIHLAAAYSTILMLMITLTFILFGRRSQRAF